MIKFIVEANNIEINYNFMYNLPYIWTRLTMCDRLSSTENRLPNAVLQQTVASSPVGSIWTVQGGGWGLSSVKVYNL